MLIDDATVAIAMAMILFFIPARSPNAAGRMVMGVDVFTKIPWHIVLLFGGGFALAQGFRVTGLSELIGTRFVGLEGVPPLAMITVVCGGLTFLTELTSNTATTEMILPILASVAVAMKVNCDLQLTLMASSLYRYLAQQIGHGYETVKSRHIYRDFIDASAQVVIGERDILVKYQKRAHNPLLIAAGLSDKTVRVPWLGGKKLKFLFG